MKTFFRFILLFHLMTFFLSHAAQINPQEPKTTSTRITSPIAPQTPQLALVREIRDQWEEDCLNKLVSSPNLTWIRIVMGVPGRRSIPVSGVLTNSVNLFQGKLWGIRYLPMPDGDNSGERGRLQLCTSSSGHEWQEAGWVDHSDPKSSPIKRNLPWILLPLENGKFIGVHSNPVHKGERESLFAIYRSNVESPVLQFDEVCDMGLEGIKIDGVPYGTSMIKSLMDQGLFRFLATEMAAMGYFRTHSYFCFTHASSGLIWVFHTKNGTLKGLYPLYDKVLTLLNQPGRIETAILRAQPQPDGHLILASRTEDAVMNARKHYPQPWKQPHISEAVLKNPVLLEELKRKLISQADPGFKVFPELIWWDFNPESGKFTKIDTPSGAPDKVWSAQDWTSLHFEFRINGILDVTFPPFQSLGDAQIQPEDTPTPGKKKEPAK